MSYDYTGDHYISEKTPVLIKIAAVGGTEEQQQLVDGATEFVAWRT
jgi:hypothetical protein